jgi:hypothetical protein
MTTGRHARRDRWVVAGAVSVIFGLCLMCGALDALISNPPNSSPGPGLGFTLLAVSLCCVGVPVTAAAGLFAVRRIRQYRAWVGGLTPDQRMMLRFAEGAAMEGAHLAMRDRNRREDARLSDSVIGIDRSAGDDQQS